LSLLRDDGAAVYLNEFKIGRDRLIAGAAFSDYAMGASVEGLDENRLYAFNISPKFLRSGTNVLAVEIHQSPDSADLSFDLQLSATRFPVPEPGSLSLLGLGLACTIVLRRFSAFRARH
jgi:PEP-CTERM motif-containing protein